MQGYSKVMAILILNQNQNVDIIGDVHGCYDELCSLLKKLGYSLDENHIFKNQPALSHPQNRAVVFVGDLVDRGPKIKEVLLLVMNILQHGKGYSVLGNHEDKLLRYLKGNPVTISPGLQTTIDQISSTSLEFKESLKAMLENLPTHIVFDNNKLVVAHAGLKEKYHGISSARERVFALYGDITGKKDEYGYPIRRDWETHYKGKAYVVYGHTPIDTATWVNNAICIDTGCVFGQRLTALRYPKLELLDIKAKKIYFKKKTV